MTARPTEPAWKPLFTGDAAAPYAAAIDDIKAALPKFEARPEDWGRPLLHAYSDLAFPSPAERAQAEALVGESLALLETQTRRFALYGGLVGVGWLAAHTDKLWDQVDDANYEDLDQGFESLCRIKPRGNYDLISGVVGVGTYFVERLPSPRAVAALQLIIESLEETAEVQGNEITWHTPPALLPEWQRIQAPDGYYNLGVAHGVPGIIGMLAAAASCAPIAQRAEELIRGAARWVLTKRRPDGSFPSWYTTKGTDREARVAWCYGELGIAAVLLSAARVLRDEQLEDTAIDIAVKCAERRTTNLTLDACLCHGFAGNGHVFNRLYQAIGHESLKTAAKFWFEHALTFQRPNAGVGGYQTWSKSLTNPGGMDWMDDVTLLSGASGVALAFLAATTSVAPGWDRLLFTEV